MSRQRLPVRLLAWLAVVLAYVAALAAIATGSTTMSLAGLFSEDTVRPWLLYRGIFQDAGWALGDWRLKNSLHLLDFMLSWPLFALGSLLGPASQAQFLVGMYATFLAWSCISAGGWMLVARLVWGREPGREAAVVIAHALPYACIAMGQEYFFVLWLWLVFHVSTWAAVPWLVWLWLRGRRARRGRALWLAGATLALFVVTLSDLLVLVWFTVPMLMALPLARMLGRGSHVPIKVMGRRGAADLALYGIPMVVATLLAKVVSDWMLHTTRPVEVSAEAIWLSMASLGATLRVMAEHSASMLVVVAAFILVAVGRPLVRMRHWWRGADFDGGAAGFPRRARTILVLLLPAMLVVPVLASIGTGLANKPADMAEWADETRYMLPTIWLPLFVGWALLPWRLPRAWVAGAGGLVLVSCAAYVAVVQPNWQRLNPFASDFHTCFAAHANERGWTGGMGEWEWLWLLADPETPMRRFASIDVHSAATGRQDNVWYYFDNSNAGWFRGTLDFVVITDSLPEPLIFPPFDRQANTCNNRSQAGCPPLDRVVDEARGRSMIGIGREELDCGDVRFGVFDPPRVSNF